MKLFYLLFVFCILIAPSAYSQSAVKLEEKQVILPTYPVAQAEKSPVFFRDEAYQGASRHYYPLKLNDQFLSEKREQPWKMILLENEYIELAIAPEIGGKLYYARDKSNDYHFIYKNNVVKPSNIGMTGAWVSGGIEWCVLHHHRASTFLPVDYTTRENDDGSKTIFVGETEPRHGMRWTIGVTAFPGKSYFKTEGRIYNATPYTHSFLYWANVAAHANNDYQTIFPPSAQIATYHSKTDFTRWPVSTEVYRRSDFTSGVDISWWKNVEVSNSFFVHELQEDFMGGYDHGKNAGTVHVGNHHIVKGAKLWEWGSGSRGQATEGRLTENDGPYVEIMVGAYSDNQPDYSWIKPYEVKKWEQYWYPVRGIRGFKNANLNGAVNLTKERDNKVFLGYYSTQKVEKARIVLRNRDKIVLERNIPISPDKPFTETIQLDNSFILTDLYTELTDSSTGELLIWYQPVEQAPVENLPDPWQGYPSPDELNTVEELYLTGQRVEQFYAPRYNALDWYLEALRRDPGDIRTNTAVGNYFLKNGDYTRARSYLSRAAKRLTNDYTRPVTCEPLYLQGLTLKALGLLDEAVDTLYRAAWDYTFHSAAFLELARIAVAMGKTGEALARVNESLSTNSRNNLAVGLKASLLRKNGEFGEAVQMLNSILDDPLDFRIQNEYFLVAKESGNMQAAEKLLAELTEKMRNFDENYLQLAAGYIKDGLLIEAEDVLKRYPEKHPLVDYYLGYVYDLAGYKEKASIHFKQGSEQPVDFIFPHRLLTVDVLKKALEYFPEDGKAYYYTGNILYEKQPDYAIDCWKNAVKYNPGLAVAYRNLGWGYYRHFENIPEAVGFYEKAIQLNNNEALYFAELDALYELNNTPVETRLNLFDGNNEVVKNRDDAFIRQIEVLTLAGKADQAVEYLDGKAFSYREGTSRVRENIIDAKLMLGKMYLENRNYQKALHFFQEAQVQEEEAGSARLGNRHIQVNYFMGLAHEALGDLTSAINYFKKAVESGSGKSTTVMDYYRGLAFARLGEDHNAKNVFKQLNTEANLRLRQQEIAETGVIFGEREPENIRKSRYYTMKGLANKGLGKTKLAKKDLNTAVNLSHSNLWAKVELDNM